MPNIRATGEETVTVGGVEYPCIIMNISWDLSFTLTFRENSTMYDDDRVSYSIHTEFSQWMIKSNHTIVRSRSWITMEIRFNMRGQHIQI